MMAAKKKKKKKWAPDIQPDISDLSPRSGQKTAKKAAELLQRIDGGRFVIPTAKARKAICIAFALSGQVVYGKAFDIVKVPPGVEVEEATALQDHLESIVLYEIKSTNKAAVKPDFKGYFFSLSTAELLVAQSLKERYRFVFVNTLTGTYTELTLQEVFARARGIYPAWSISF